MAGKGVWGEYEKIRFWRQSAEVTTLRLSASSEAEPMHVFARRSILPGSERNMSERSKKNIKMKKIKG